MTTTKQITLDVSRPNNISAISAKQFDEDSRFLKIYLVNGGEELSVESDSAVLINVLRADGESNSYSGSVNEDGSVTVPLSNWLLSVEGMASASVSIVQDGVRLTSLSFDISVQVCETSDEPSEDEKDVWAQALSDIAEMKSVVEELSADNNELLNAVGYEAQITPTERTYHSEYYAPDRKDRLSFDAFIITGDLNTDTDEITPIVNPFSEEAEDLMLNGNNSVTQLLDEVETYVKQVYPSAQIEKICSYQRASWGESHYVLAWEIRFAIRDLTPSVFDELKEQFEEQIVNFFDSADKYTWTVPPQAITKELKEI